MLKIRDVNLKRLLFFIERMSQALASPLYFLTPIYGVELLIYRYVRKYRGSHAVHDALNFLRLLFCETQDSGIQ